ncbi:MULTISPECIES: ABC transporter permease [Vibrio]|jgi:iron complex transport system permease protein|uniref:ABC transporter permease n=2 Tax=Vibrio TaxID=662 RepID=A0A0H3ZZQ5_9VIBR|nr:MULTISPECIES: iron chelate uptake ABC transporter family permease subunit [Vibrio]AKN37708.1 Iron compound ABC uptake transporter permease protein PiuC [Vibrio sp. 1S_269]AKN35672.1 Iron compound ABC uptake transporter permease protein PiuC [Vibrio kanaloae]AKN37362.1 Iron compound ABC uptake transporter permease protein PiuC [Vibrio kanaloae]AKN38855.1 Iron compound ABC uptake transporter permease protein PiuC [Vibrio kanaloae]AKN38892.1 Iron transport protein [Vibrio kanaloae]
MTFRMILAFFTLCVISLFFGASQIEWSLLSTLNEKAWLPIIASRLPRLVALILTGSGLAMCGVILQHIVRNRFVEPGTTGSLDAAKLGILVSIVILPSSDKLERMLFAVLFCFAAGLVYIAIIRKVKFSNTALVPVIGLMFGSVLSALAEFYAYQNNILQSMSGWLMGDFSKVVQEHYEVIFLILPITLLTYLYAHRFTVMGMGEDIASNLGISYAMTAALGLILVSITVAVTVVTVGAIHFVGLVIPNLVALKYGDHLKNTLPIVALGGASLLIFCDVISRVVLFPFEVPVGLTASAVGGVMFLVFLLKGAKT